MAGCCPEKDTTVEKKRKTNTGGSSVSPAQRLKWAALLGAFQGVINWGLDAAARLAHQYPDEVETIERVRAFVSGRIRGRSAPIELDDLLFAFALAMAAIDHERGEPGAFGAWIERQPVRVANATDLERQWLEQLLWTYDAVQSRLRSAA